MKGVVKNYLSVKEDSMGNFVDIKGIFSSVVNFSMQQNRIPVIQSLQLVNKTQSVLQNIVVDVLVKPNFAKPVQFKVENLGAEQSVDLDGKQLRLEPDYFMAITERVTGYLGISVKVNGVDDIRLVRDLDVLAYNEWSGLQVAPELVASFVTPNHPFIAKVQRRAAEKMKEWTGNSAMCGYQRQSENDVRKQMAAIFAALEEQSVAYSMPPAGFEIGCQKIRLCDEISSQKLGTCLDLSVLYASCLESVGLNPVLVFIKGHAFVGCWLVPESFPSPCQDDFSLLSKRFSEDVGEMTVVECTLFAGGTSASFEEAERAAKNHFLDEKKFDFFVDVKSARAVGIRPLPQRKYDENGAVIGVEEIENETATWAAPKDIEVVKIENSEGPVKLTKQRIWQNKLLNLSTRNSLLSFKPTGNSIQLLCSNLSVFEDALAAGEEFKIVELYADAKKILDDNQFARLDEHEKYDEPLKTDFASKRLRSFLNESETLSRMIGLYRKAKASLEENGSNTLYLALGFLKWYENDISEKARYAPLVLLPLEIVRKSARQGYAIRARDEETQFNITLLEKLHSEFDIVINGLDPLPVDEKGVDLKKIFAIVRQAILDKKRWTLEEHACIGQFSFSQYIMWNDLGSRCDEIEDHMIVRGLIDGIVRAEMPSLVSVDSLDAEFKPSDMAVPLSADSSQLAAIASAAKGCSFVLHGPPGTGKSQTITNMIANALFNGKSVLFIAEKMAALSVVQSRLEKIGLGPFCLELHSNKANKAYVMNQLQSAMEFGRRKNPAEYAVKATELHQAREHLNAIMEKIHKVRKCGKSLYQIIGDFEAHRDLLHLVDVPMQVVSDADEVALNKWLADCEMLAVAAGNCGDVAKHPLKKWTCSLYSEQKRIELEQLLRECKSIVVNLASALKQMQEKFALRNVDSREKLLTIQKLSETLGKVDALPLGLFKIPASDTQVAAVCEEGRKLNELRQSLETVFEKEIYAVDALALRSNWKEAEAKWFLPKFLGQNKVRSQLRCMAKNPKGLSKSQIPALLQNLIDANQLVKSIEAQGASLASYFEIFWKADKSDWNLLETRKDVAIVMELCISKLFDDENDRQMMRQKLVNTKRFRMENESLFADFNNACNSFAVCWKKISDIVCMGGPVEFGESWVSKLDAEIDQWTLALPQWRSWCSYQSCRKTIVDAGLESVALALESGKICSENLVASYRANVAYDLAIKTIDEETEIANMTAFMLEHEIGKYKDAVSQFENLTCRELIARLSANIPSASFAGDTTEIGILKKNISNKCRGKSIRQLFDSIPILLRRLAPCMLMSPISVAQYINPKFPKFDLVIFDEASQLPTCEAVGAIARGKSLVVVGDPKQMPPTNFFKKGYTDEDNLDKEDLESILDDCLAISMPETHLLWHYRSKDESLIAFSNYRYYEQKLYTFPSPASIEGNVRFIPVTGFYDKSKTRQNNAEANAIVKEIVRRLMDPVLRNKSIGVVTFSVVQQDLIEDLLEKEFAKSLKLEEYSKVAKEPIFIKNLESVQGDERDVVMFSIGYGPNADGKVSMNFGPINNAGGWRRLNVAVSRAREEMLVFSTLQPEQIDLNRTSSEGVAGLKAFLFFAKHGKKVLSFVSTEEIEQSEKDCFKDSVARALTAAGFKVMQNVGCSKYKMDLAIVNPECENQFILGILCDGETYRNSATAKDRNVLQQQVLESLGWNVMRLWSVEWFMNREGRSGIVADIKKRVAELLTQKKAAEATVNSAGAALDAIAQTVTNAKMETATDAQAEAVTAKKLAGSKTATGVSNKAAAKSQAKTAAKLQSEEDDIVEEKSAISSFKPYAVAKVREASSDADVYAASSASLLRKQIKDVISIESPIAESVMQLRIAEKWNMKRTPKFQTRISEVCADLSVVKIPESGRVFYWWKNPQQLVPFRMPSETFKRDVNEISICELASVVKAIVDEQMSIEKDELERLVAKIAGFTKCTAPMKEVIDDAIQYAVLLKIVKEDGTRIAVASM